jgi:beta-1,4-mannosyl-glycoprotein beta-1,4-N-acetylglucosaminyltransferase
MVSYLFFLISIFTLICMSAALHIVDLFMYNGEPVAVFRVQYLYQVVDEFVIVESHWTHSGKRKPTLYFHNEEYSIKFAPYMDKIRFIEVSNIPAPFNWAPLEFMSQCETCTENWWRSFYQSYVGGKYLLDRAGTSYDVDNTVIFVCDVDEIPRQSVVRGIRLGDLAYEMLDNPIRLQMKLMYYNFKWVWHEDWYRGLVINLRGVLSFNGRLDDIRLTAPMNNHIADAGWHLSYFMSLGDLVRKIESFTHAEFDRAEVKDTYYISQRIAEGENFFDGSKARFLLDPQSDLPEGWEGFQENLLASQIHVADNIQATEKDL